MTALAEPTDSTIQPSTQTRYSFITLLDPEELFLPSQRKAVRSHAAAYQHAQARKESCSQPARKRRPRKPKRIALLPPVDGQSIILTLAESRSSDSRESPLQKALAHVIYPLVTSPKSPVFGQGRVDPFRTYPVPWEPFIPELVDHYLHNMAVDVPELDGPEKPGLLTTRWFPLVMTEAATFQVTMLLAASHCASLRKPIKNGPDLLLQKSKVLSLICNALSTDGPSDQLIGAVAKMACYEAMFGDLISFDDHMRGLVKMVQVRGGLLALGLNGMLAMMCVWIDRNFTFWNDSPNYFTSVPEHLSMQVNVGGFLRLMV